MDSVSSKNWALPWILRARQIPHGAVVAGLIVDLATDARQDAGAHTVQFPLAPAARALGVQPVLLRTALNRLAEAGMLHFRIDDHTTDGPRATVSVLTVTSPSP